MRACLPTKYKSADGFRDTAPKAPPNLHSRPELAHQVNGRLIRYRRIDQALGRSAALLSALVRLHPDAGVGDAAALPGRQGEDRVQVELDDLRELLSAPRSDARCPSP